MSNWKDEIRKERVDWRLENESKFYYPSKYSIPNELSSKVDYLFEILEERELNEKEKEVVKKVIEIYDTYVNHMGPKIDKLR